MFSFFLEDIILKNWKKKYQYSKSNFHLHQSGIIFINQLSFKFWINSMIFEKNFVDKSKNKLFISTVWIFFTQYNVCKYTRLVTVSLNKFKCYKLQCSLYIIIQRLQSKTLFSPNGATFQNTKTYLIKK